MSDYTPPPPRPDVEKVFKEVTENDRKSPPRGDQVSLPQARGCLADRRLERNRLNPVVIHAYRTTTVPRPVGDRSAPHPRASSVDDTVFACCFDASLLQTITETRLALSPEVSWPRRSWPAR